MLFSSSNEDNNENEGNYHDNASNYSIDVSCDLVHGIELLLLHHHAIVVSSDILGAYGANILIILISATDFLIKNQLRI